MKRLPLWSLPLAIAACSSNASTPSTTLGPSAAAAGTAAATSGAAATSVVAGTAAPSVGAAAGSGAGVKPATAAGTTAAGAPTATSGTTAAGAAGVGAGTAGASAGQDPASCRGFPFEGIKYSPGGSVLPNKCMPFHPTTNNPYAVRCVDVWPWYKTQFPGDEFCILPPPPDKGIGYGVHPQGKKWFEQVSAGDMSGYENLSTEWTMEDGEEEQKNYQTQADNPMDAQYYRNYARMRPGSHHMIVSSDNNQAQETWAEGGPGLASLSLPGAQRPDENGPKSLDKPAEDKGLFAKLPANAPVIFNMHHFNASGRTILKEAWTNLWWETDATTEMKPIFGLELSQTATLAVQPGQVLDLHYSWNVTQPFRWVTAFGHRHAWTTNFSSWIEDGGKTNIVYQSLNWLDEPTYRYDSVTMNPTPNAANRIDGGSSGVLMVKAGQKIHFNCHIEYTDARAASEKAPMPESIGTLRFANEAFTAEMCILFGSTTDVALTGPAQDTSPLPDFAKH